MQWDIAIAGLFIGCIIGLTGMGGGALMTPALIILFKVDPSVIMTYNRLYFEPEHFANGQLVFVPGAEVPAMKRITAPRYFSPAPGQLPARTGRLLWPVNGFLTQYFL